MPEQGERPGCDMTTLIVTLPLEGIGPSTELSYVLSADNETMSAQGCAPAARLPVLSGRGATRVAIVPARALSWHQVRLPATLRKLVARTHTDQPRLRAALAGLLEEYLLEEPEQLHFAVFPGADPDAPLWVAACNRAWLEQALRTLEAAQHPIDRIVPAFVPLVNAAITSTVHVSSGPQTAELVLCTSLGVTVLPLGAAASALVAHWAPGEACAEPAVAGLAEQVLGQAVKLQTRAQRQLLLSRSSWDLAQLELSASRRSRSVKTVIRGWHALTHEPLWRPVRWGMVLLVLTQVLGLNALAWKERSLIEQKRQAVHSLFTQTFPAVPVIVDAPLQMAREVAALRQTRGQPGGPDLIGLATVLTEVLPVPQSPSAIELVAGEFHVRGLTLPAEELATLSARLATQGWHLRADGEQWVMEMGEPR